MGTATSKVLLPVEGKPILGHLLSALMTDSIEACVVVVRKSDHQVAELAHRHGAIVVRPSTDPADMRASVEHALAWIEENAQPDDSDGWLLTPADNPSLTSDLIRTLCREWCRREPQILVPVFNGRRGHPALFPWSLSAALRDLDHKFGVNRLLNQTNDTVREVPMDDPSILVDIDFPEEYSDFLDRRA